MNLQYIGSSIQKHACICPAIMTCSLYCFLFEVTSVTLLFINHRLQVYTEVLAAYCDLPVGSRVLLLSATCMPLNFIFAS